MYKFIEILVVLYFFQVRVVFCEIFKIYGYYNQEIGQVLNRMIGNKEIGIKYESVREGEE